MTLSAECKQISREQLMLGKSALSTFELLKKRQFKVSYSSVLTYFKSEKERAKNIPHEYRSNILKDDTESVMHKVREEYEKYPKLSERMMVNHLKKEFGVQMTRPVLRALKQEADLHSYRTIKVPKINDNQKMRRFNLVSDWYRQGETFDKWMWSDETSVQLGGNVGYVTVSDKYDPKRLSETKQYPVKIMAFGVITPDGPGPFVVLKHGETMKSGNYLEIIEEYLLPFIDSSYGRTHAIFQQDLATCHTSADTLAKFNEWNVTLAQWAPVCPDLSPIEYIWREMKLWVNSVAAPTTRTELEDACVHWWNTYLTKEMIRKYITHIQSNAKKVRNNMGGPIVDRWPH